MMKKYARIDEGVVVEIILLEPNEDGGLVPIEQRFTADFVGTLVDISDLDPSPGERWSFDGSSFTAPITHQPEPEQIRATNISTRDFLLEQAGFAIAPLQDAADLDDATAAETALLKKWKQYRVAVNRIDLALENPSWPVQPS